METENNFIESVNSVIQTGVEKGILHLNLTEVEPSKSKFKIGENEFLNFGSCSYLGLEFNPKMKANSIKMIEQFGTQFSSSRAYLSIGLYQELESLLQHIFNRHVVVAQTTSLAHIASLPVMIHENDAVIIDHQVHNSVQTAAQILKSKNIHVEMIRHNRMDLLEERILHLQQSYKKVWYLADGIYSMYGDAAPLNDLKSLLQKYQSFHLYIDDAHGMSCYGKNGCGFVLSELNEMEKVIVVVSLNKAFASGGSAILLKNKKWASLIRTCGGPLITSGPLQPAQLGSAIAAAKIHLSDEIISLQEKLKNNIIYTNLLLKKYELPLVHESDSPVFYIAAGKPKLAYEIIQTMMTRGYYLNLGTFPAVPIKNSGVRFTITAVHNFEMILQMIQTLSEVYFTCLRINEISIEQVYKAFKMNLTKTYIAKAEEKQNDSLIIQNAKSIDELNEREWNSVMESRGIFNYEGLQILERSFVNHPDPLIQWEFDYLLIKDDTDEVLLATFFTSAMVKDDMLASEEISLGLEELRETLKNPAFHSNKMIMTGSLFTEGEHLYINRSNKKYSIAIELFYKETERLIENRKAAGMIVRDFYSSTDQLDQNMLDNGFFRSPMPNSFMIKFSDKNRAEYWSMLSKNAKSNLKREVLRCFDEYSFEIQNQVSETTLKQLYELYLQVKCGSLSLNTYDLPFELFIEMNKPNAWQFLILKDSFTENIVGFVAAYRSGLVYHPMLVGVDKTIDRKKSPYRQLLYRLIDHARKEGYQEVRLGFSADTEKKKFGAIKTEAYSYLQVKDNFMFESLQFKSTDSLINIE